MEIVNFFEHSIFHEKAWKLFLEQQAMIEVVIPKADVQHVGSTAVPNSLTKGDLDIQVRVKQEEFLLAVHALSKLYSLNDGSISTDSFRAFTDNLTDPPLGVQLTVINSEFDFFWKFRDVLLKNDNYRVKYDELKKDFDGKEMDDYRKGKNTFFEWLLETPELKALSSNGER
ncbi:GrpB family protein [Paenibacillus alba]|uniref:GrpB family protein n=1 Tax=Paenibacillus alba TaxID=1197127 RepID=A0ABU6GDK8_9BACL|nr:GrpB family protein [Paenibacillus alba]MEC0232298.1 GrpB family protein [Paenibacillus alba]